MSVKKSPPVKVVKTPLIEELTNELTGPLNVKHKKTGKEHVVSLSYYQSNIESLEIISA